MGAEQIFGFLSLFLLTERKLARQADLPQVAMEMESSSKKENRRVFI